MNKPDNVKQVRIAYEFMDNSETSIDPAAIATLDQALIIKNIYSRLVEYDDNGNAKISLRNRS
jgi:ABC-type transport system substrate-binding protein